MIYNANCLIQLPKLKSASVDAVITDPPYCSGAAGLAGKQQSTAIKYQKTGTLKAYPEFIGDGKDQRSFTRWAFEWLSECFRIAKPGVPLLLFSDWRQLPLFTDVIQMADWHWRGLLVWHKPSGRPAKGEFRRDAEFIVYATKGKRTPFNSVCLPGTFSYPVLAHQKYHITGKPLPLMRDLLEIVPPGGRVLDPFLGSGTTAVACAETGRECVGVEVSAEYCEVAKRRIREAIKAA